MDKVKPYLFYIVCGVILVIELVVVLLFAPSHPEAPGDTVADTKRHADQAYEQKLTKETPPLGLLRRAEKTLSFNNLAIPENPRRPEDPEHVSEILDNYIIHASWNDHFRKVVADYEQQLRGIRKDLLDRSEPLGEPIATSTDPGQWYQAYLEQSVKLLAQALEYEVLVEPAQVGGRGGGRGGGTFGTGRFGGGDFDRPAEEAPASTEWSQVDLAENAGLRSVIGLTTQTSPWPTREDHPRLTTQFHIIQRVVEAMIRVEAVAVANPSLVAVDGLELSVPQPEGPSRAKVVSLTWGESQPSGLRGGRYHRFDLRLRGTPSALLAALARLDSMTTPVVVRLGSNWTPVDPRSAGSATTGDMEVTAALLVVDFRGLEDIDLTEIQAEPAAMGAPGGGSSMGGPPSDYSGPPQDYSGPPGGFNGPPEGFPGTEGQ